MQSKSVFFIVSFSDKKIVFENVLTSKQNEGIDTHAVAASIASRIEDRRKLLKQKQVKQLANIIATRVSLFANSYGKLCISCLYGLLYKDLHGPI